MYCNYQQDNWSDLLPLTEFAYNNAPSATTGASPFYANKGYHPNLSILPEPDLTSSQATTFVANLSELHSYLKSAISNAQKQYQGPADSRRTPPPNFQVGNHAYVLAKFFRSTHPSRKLSE